MRFYLLVCTLIVLLAGCAEQRPQLFGIPLAQWKHLTETQRQSLIEQYNVNKLSHYKTEPKITMDLNNTETKPSPEPELSILDEHQTQGFTPPSHKISSKPTMVVTTPPQQVPIENNWLILNE